MVHFLVCFNKNISDTETNKDKDNKSDNKNKEKKIEEKKFDYDELMPIQRKVIEYSTKNHEYILKMYTLMYLQSSRRIVSINKCTIED